MLPTARGPPWRPSVRPGVDLRSLLLPLDAAGLGIWREMVQACVAGAEGGERDHVDGCQVPPTPTRRGGLGNVRLGTQNWSVISWRGEWRKRSLPAGRLRAPR